MEEQNSNLYENTPRKSEESEEFKQIRNIESGVIQEALHSGFLVRQNQICPQWYRNLENCIQNNHKSEDDFIKVTEKCSFYVEKLMMQKWIQSKYQ